MLFRKVYNRLYFETKRLPKRLLHLFFRFDRWHVSSASERKYVKDIVCYLNKLPVEDRKSIVEIGCGLGDILRKISFKKKYGLDVDQRVLNAAIFLNRFYSVKAEYKTFSFPDSVFSGKYNVIIMVNWIHHFNSEVLKEKIADYFHNNLENNGWLIIDTVESATYRFNHDIKFLTSGLEAEVSAIGSYENGRSVYSVRKTVK